MDLSDEEIARKRRKNVWTQDQLELSPAYPTKPFQNGREDYLNRATFIKQSWLNCSVYRPMKKIRKINR